MTTFKRIIPVAVIFMGFLSGISCTVDYTNDTSSSGNRLEGPVVGCPWYRDTDNCWRQTVQRIDSCLLDDIWGDISADGRTCVDGSSGVYFDEPLVIPPSSTQGWDFSIKRAGRTCVEFSAGAPINDNYRGLVVIAPNGMYQESYVGDGLQISCPDGRKYQVPNPDTILGCGDGNYPGYGITVSNDRLEFNLTGDGFPPLELFRCDVN